VRTTAVSAVDCEEIRVDFMTSVKTVLSKYADFNGRARRSEFWWWVLAVEILNIILRVGVPILGLLLALAVIVPNLAVGSRRLHDTGKSGWLQLIALTVIGIIPLIVFYCQDSEAAPNKYGPNPKAVGGDDPLGYGPPPPGYGTPPPGYGNPPAGL
jgi:uncharacterized membrane protein YhaH (DUF805 family)